MVMRILVLTSCTGQKATSHRDALLFEDFDNADRLRRREKELEAVLRPAGTMYTGQQHVRAMRAVRDLRSVLGADEVTVAIVSAGYGLVDEDRLIAPYDLTFTTMSTTAIRSRGQQLGVPVGVRARLIGHDLVFALLGSDYLTAVDPPLPAAAGQRIVYFAKPGESQIARGGGVLVPAGKVEAGRYGAGLVALKGRLLELVGAAVLRQGRALLEDIHADATPTTILAALDQQARIR